MTTLRISDEKARRLIAQRLRDRGQSPADANETARVLVEALMGARETAHRIGLQGWRMIPPWPEGEIMMWLRGLAPNTDDSGLREIWSGLIELSRPIPDDLTDEKT